MHKITISVDMPNEIRDMVSRALKVESGREIPRTKVEIKSKKDFKMIIYGEDVHALRAAVNSYLRWLDLAIKVVEVIENGNKSNPDAQTEN